MANLLRVCILILVLTIKLYTTNILEILGFDNSARITPVSFVS